jgi:hypothetical protein
MCVAPLAQVRTCRRLLSEKHICPPQVLQTLFNLCRLNKGRQEETAQSGIIPRLRELVASRSPLRQFALPYVQGASNCVSDGRVTDRALLPRRILFDFASASKGSRAILWKTDGLRRTSLTLPTKGVLAF